MPITPNRQDLFIEDIGASIVRSLRKTSDKMINAKGEKFLYLKEQDFHKIIEDMENRIRYNMNQPFWDLAAITAKPDSRTKFPGVK